MSDHSKITSAGGLASFIISKTFNATLEKAWKSWTDPNEMSQWFGPSGSKIVHAKMDFREGGFYHFGMEAMGQTMWGKCQYLEIFAPYKLVYINMFSDENEAITRHPLSASWPLEMHTTIGFEEIEPGQTTVTIEWIPQNASPDENKTFDENRDGMRMGWIGTFDQFEAYLAK